MFFFSKTIAAFDLKVGKCIELNDLMILHEYQSSRSFFDPHQKSLSFQTKIFFFFVQKLLSYLKPNTMCKIYGVQK